MTRELRDIFRESHAAREKAMGPAVRESVDVEDIGVRVRRRVSARRRTRALVTTGILATLLLGVVMVTQVTRGSQVDVVGATPGPALTAEPGISQGPGPVPSIPGGEELTPEVVATIDENWIAGIYMAEEERLEGPGMASVFSHALYIASPDGHYYLVQSPVPFSDGYADLIRFDSATKTIVLEGAHYDPDASGGVNFAITPFHLTIDLDRNIVSEGDTGLPGSELPDVGGPSMVTYLGRSGTSTVWTAALYVPDGVATERLAMVSADGATSFVPSTDSLGYMPLLSPDGALVAGSGPNGTDGYMIIDLASGNTTTFAWPRAPFCQLSSWADPTHLLVECEAEASTVVDGEVLKTDPLAFPAGVYEIDVTTGTATLAYVTNSDDEVYSRVFDVGGALVGGSQPAECVAEGEVAVFADRPQPFNLANAVLAPAERPEGIDVRGNWVYFQSSVVRKPAVGTCDSPRDGSAFRVNVDTGEVITLLPRASAAYAGTEPLWDLELFEVILAD